VLFLYGFFGQIAYAFWPERVFVLFGGQYYGEEIFYKYWAFIFLSFFLIFLLGRFLYRRPYKGVSVKIYPRKSDFLAYIKPIFFFFIYLTLEAFLLYSFLANFEYLSYSNVVRVLKSDKLWFYCFSFNSVVLFALWVKIDSVRTKKSKIFYGILFVGGLIVSLATAFKSGQRIQLISLIIMFFGYYLSEKHSKNFIRNLGILFFLIFLAVATSQVVKYQRSQRLINKDPIYVLIRKETYAYFFRNIVFQDYTPPSISLITSMHNNIIIPDKVLYTSATSLVPFLKHVTLGNIMARIADPGGSGGWAYYFLTEGYNFMGNAGVIYNVVIFTYGTRMLTGIFYNSVNEKKFNSYMRGCLGLISLLVVRGQGFFFIKGIYLFLLPSLAIYFLLFNVKIKIMKVKQFLPL
jgi:positive regulator of sigma E activity